MIPERDESVLHALCKYYILSRPQIQHLCFATDKTGRSTRRRLQALVSMGLINRHRAEFRYPTSTPVGSVYYPSIKGREYLAQQTGDERFVLTPVQSPQPHHVLHWLAVSDTHILLDAAIEAQNAVEIEGWINEWDIVNKDESDPSKRFRLYRLLSENPRLICAPDAGFLLSTGGYKKVFLLEQDRGTSGAKQVAARKSKGYVALTTVLGHRNYFPETNLDTFTVLCVAPTTRRRDALKKAMRGKPGEELWKFCAASEMTPQSMLSEPIMYATVGDPVPLVKAPSNLSVEPMK